MPAPCPEREGCLDELGLLLRCAREAQGCTQRELAGRLRVPLKTVQRWEDTNYAGVRVATLMRVSEVLRARVFVKLDWLLTAAPTYAAGWLDSSSVASAAADTSGRNTVKRAPCPGSLSTSTRPPIS